MAHKQRRGEQRVLYTGCRLLILSAIVGFAHLISSSTFPILAVTSSTVREGVVLASILPCIPQALATIREERSRTAAERDTFESFSRAVANANTSETKTNSPEDRMVTPAGVSISAPISGSDRESEPGSLGSIRQAYNGTVMSVDHYEIEYDETLERNMAIEFGPEVAHVVAEADTLTAQLQMTLLQKSQQSKRERESFLQILETERENVVESKRILRDIQEKIDSISESLSYGSARELIEEWKRLDEMENECTKLLVTRQSELHTTIENRSIFSIQQYLYSGQEWTFPVLHDTLDTIERLRTTKYRTVEALSKWR